MALNLYKLTQDVRRGYDTYSDCVVAAPDTTSARHIHPNTNWAWSERREEWALNDWDDDDLTDSSWALPNDVTATYIGVAADDVEHGVVCASFHAG